MSRKIKSGKVSNPPLFILYIYSSTCFLVYLFTCLLNVNSG